MGCNFPVGAFNGLPTGSCCHQAPNSQASVKKQLLLTAVKKGDENEGTYILDSSEVKNAD
jgi:hypothetical protein